MKGMSVNIKLKICPFCGRNPTYKDDLITTVGGSGTRYYLYFIECSRCVCRGPQSLDEKIAIKLWNKRYKRKAKTCSTINN